MSALTITNEPCHCPAGHCAHFVEPDSDCVNRLVGDVRTEKCPRHSGLTWHHNGNCLRCARKTAQ